MVARTGTFKDSTADFPGMDETAGIYAREVPGLDRHVQLGVAGRRVISVSVPRDPDADAGGDHELLDRLVAYFEGEREDFSDVTVALTLPTDRRAVLETLRSVPYGESATVAALARMTPDLDDEDEDDLALVRDALRENPVPILCPDHRVSDGPSALPGEVARACREVEGL